MAMAARPPTSPLMSCGSEPCPSIHGQDAGRTTGCPFFQGPSTLPIFVTLSFAEERDDTLAVYICRPDGEADDRASGTYRERCQGRDR